MKLTHLWQSVLQWSGGQHTLDGNHAGVVDQTALPRFGFSEQWRVLGPFQIGTREATWGADPLEFDGGFRSLEYDDRATFRSSLAYNGSVGWSNYNATLSTSANYYAAADLHVEFSDIDWQGLRDTYGWASLQWQGWARGEIVVRTNETKTLALNTPSIIEYWIDGVHHFGGDFYGYGRASHLLHLDSGTHRIDVRLVYDVRAMGGAVPPAIDVKLELVAPVGSLEASLQVHGPLLISDMVGTNDDSVLAGPYASATVRNNADCDIEILSVEASHNACLAELVSKKSIRLVSGQTRPIAFNLACATPIMSAPLFGHILVDLKYRKEGDEQIYGLGLDFAPRIRRVHEPHKMTYMHVGGVVSYAVLRPPSARVVGEVSREEKLPIMLILHGAGVEADSELVRRSLDPLPDLRTWALFPSGVTPWSGDDWHTWGFEDVEAAITAIRYWIYQVGWDGPGVEVNEWLVTGHSNGGQGAWYALTHRPANIIAAAPLSGYSSIQNYIPYTFWHPAEPDRIAIVQGALLGFRHELLLKNAQGIPILQQHGSVDDNVPVYHSRFLGQLIHEAGTDSEYFEMPGKPHYWDGVMTTEPLAAFYERNLATRHLRKPRIREFKLAVANPGDTGSKYGIEILRLAVPGRLGGIEVEFDPTSLRCIIRLINIRQFHLPFDMQECFWVLVDDQLELPASAGNVTLTKENGKWRVDPPASELIPPGIWPRVGRQMGNMDAVLRTVGQFVILRHSAAASRMALQISRNLCQYFGADTEIIDDWGEAIDRNGNVISLAIGDDFPEGIYPTLPIQMIQNYIVIRDQNNLRTAYGNVKGLGIGAIFIRPLRLGRVEIVVWGLDEESLEMAARLVPMMTGVGQPDFIVMDRTMAWRGLDGALAMGFFDSQWQVSKNSFLQDQ